MRIRRDVPALLSLVKSSALMHQAQRRVDERGRIVAEFDDYVVVLGALGGGLEEIAHGDTAAIDAVRAAVGRALAQARRDWGRARACDAFRAELTKYLADNNRSQAIERLAHIRKSSKGRASTETIGGCIAHVTASDPTIQISDQVRGVLYRKAIGAARRDAFGKRPAAVELSSQRLAALLGLGRKAARVRLDNAIEAGSVIDVGALDKDRPRTAPKLLAPGAPAKPKSTPGSRAGAFPPAELVRQTHLKNLGGSDAGPSGPRGQAEG